VVPGKPAVVVACNFTNQPQKISFDLSALGIAAKRIRTLTKTPGIADPISLDEVQLLPYGVYIGEAE
jgi:alpha-glucosidase